MASNRTNFTSPVGRVVMGSLYKANTTDADGKPLTVKTGPNAGQLRSNFFFALAVPKGTEQTWSQTEWGKIIAQVGYAAFPQAAQSPAFAWKVEDGDSIIPNKKGKRPSDNEGWAGNWILKFSGGFAPKIYRQENGGLVQVVEEGFVKPGYFVEVAGSIDGNNSQQNPGIYLNHSMVCFRAYGPEIVFGSNANDAGFGAAPLPAGATLTPPASAIPMPAGAPMGIPAPALSALPVSYAQVAAQVPASVPAVPVMQAPATVGVPIVATAVVPNPAFLQVPAVNPTPAALPATASIAAIPQPPVIASPSSGPQMTAKAGGASYQAYISAGWDHANLVAQGYVTA